MIVDDIGRPEAAIEFKYHRDIPSGATTAKTMKAGQIFQIWFGFRESQANVNCTLCTSLTRQWPTISGISRSPYLSSSISRKVVVWTLSQSRSQECLRHFILIWEIGRGRFVSLVCSEENCQRVTI